MVAVQNRIVCGHSLVRTNVNGSRNVLTLVDGLDTKRAGSGLSTTPFGAYLLVDLLNEGHGTKLTVVPHDVANRVLLFGLAWQGLEPLLNFPTSDIIAYGPQDSTLGHVVYYSNLGNSLGVGLPVPETLPGGFKPRTDYGIALVAKNVTSRDLVIDAHSGKTLFEHALANLSPTFFIGAELQLDALVRAVNELIDTVGEFRVVFANPEQRMAAVHRFPRENCRVEPDGETTVPAGFIVSQSHAQSVMLHRRLNGPYVGPVIRYLHRPSDMQDMRDLVGADTLPQGRFGVVVEVPIADIPKMCDLGLIKHETVQQHR